MEVPNRVGDTAEPTESPARQPKIWIQRMVRSATFHHCVAIVPLGVDEPSVRCEFPERDFLTRIVSDLETVEEVTSVTIHSTTMGQYQIPLIDCEVSPGGGFRLGRRKFEQFDGPDNLSPTAIGLALRIDHHLPDVFGVEIVAYDPISVGTTPVPTSRLLTTDDGATTLTGTKTDYPVKRLLAETAEKGQPHLLGVVLDVSGNGTSIPVEVRFGTFGPRDRWATRDEFVAFFETRDDIAARFADDAITSNVGLTQHHRWQSWDFTDDRTLAPYPVLGHQPQQAAATPNQSLIPLRSGAEYRGLVKNATGDLDDIYRELGYSPTLSVPKTQLASLLEIPRNYGVQNPWLDCHDREQPLCRTLYIVSDATGTNQELDETPHPAAATTTTTEIEGSLQPRLAGACARYFREQGNQITVRSDACPAIAFERDPGHGPASLVIAGSRQTLTAGTLIGLATAAETADWTLTVCTPSTEDINWVATVLCRPYTWTQGPWTGLYDLPQCPVWTSGSIPFVPDPAAELQWALHRERTVALISDGERLAQGPVADPAAVLNGDLPEYRVTQDAIFGPDGTCRERNVTPDEFADRSQPVPWPAVMAQLSHLANTALLVEKRGRFVPPFLQPSWDSNRYAERNIGAGKAFLSQYTREQAGSTLPIPEIRPRFQSWIGNQTTLRPPSDEEAAAALHGANGNNSPAAPPAPLQDRTWQYPLGLKPSIPDGLLSTVPNSIDTDPHPRTVLNHVLTHKQQHSE